MFNANFNVLLYEILRIRNFLHVSDWECEKKRDNFIVIF